MTNKQIIAISALHSEYIKEKDIFTTTGVLTCVGNLTAILQKNPTYRGDKVAGATLKSLENYFVVSLHHKGSDNVNIYEIHEDRLEMLYNATEKIRNELNANFQF